MALLLSIHPQNPQARLITRAVDILRSGGVIVYPTDSCYALGCLIGAGDALERLRKIRRIDAKHHLTLMCRDLSDFGTYARVDNVRFRLIKTLTPGPYTFILQATRELPKRVLHASRKTIGVRIPDHGVAQALLAALGEPLVSATLTLPDADEPFDDAMEVEAQLGKLIDLLIDSGSCGTTPTTVVELTGEQPVITRVGNGSIALFEQ
ncbi:MAG: threonylcarbamoyl-AMP synthase [Betaproteobacteria bacterium]|nr:threonylcarbamoyl-AMP synthase [Betaproteobacteria bacterium]